MFSRATLVFFAALAVLATLAGCTGDTSTPSFSAPVGARVYDHVTVIDADGRREDRAVAIHGGMIVAVEAAGGLWPEGVEVIDATGRFLMPGLVDTHVHLALSGATKWVGSGLGANLRANLYHGVLAVMDVGSTPRALFNLRDRVTTGEILGPTIRATGPFLTALGSHPCEHFPYRECVFIDATNAARQSKALLEAGADALKLALADAAFTPWPTPRLALSALDRAAAVAAQAGVPMIVHVDANADAIDAVAAADAAGAELVLAHPVFAGPLSAEALAATTRARAVHTTLGAFGAVVQLLDATVKIDTSELIVAPGVVENWQLIKSNPQKLLEGYVEHTRRWFATAKANLQAMKDAGATLAVGTDAGYLFIPHGLGLRWELRGLVELGWTPLEALSAATLGGRQLLGLPGGRVRAGDPADLLLLTADPLASIDNVGAIETVVLRGEAYSRESLRTRDLYPQNASPEDGVCLEADDCQEGYGCDRLDNICRRRCRRAYGSITGCGPDAWCMPADALFGTAENVCRREAVRCDPNTQRGCERFQPPMSHSTGYRLACQPLDNDTAGCRASGDGDVDELCTYNELGSSCRSGLYCSPISSKCLALCDPTQEIEPCPEPRTCQWQLDDLGNNWFALCL